MKKTGEYFTYVPFKIALILNLLLETAGSAAMLLAYTFLSNERFEPTAEDIVKGVFIIIMTAAVTVALNLAALAVCKKVRKKQALQPSPKRVKVYTAIILCLLIVPPVLFFISPDGFAYIYMWWM